MEKDMTAEITMNQHIRVCEGQRLGPLCARES